MLRRGRSPPILSRRPLYFSIVFVAASRLPRRQRYCHRAISNADVDAPPARPVSRLTLPVATRRDNSYRTVCFASALLLLLRRACFVRRQDCHYPQCRRRCATLSSQLTALLWYLLCLNLVVEASSCHFEFIVIKLCKCVLIVTLHITM